MIITAWAFSRWMALIYLAAFWSLALQVLGLIGSHGILPVNDYLQAVVQQEVIHPYWSAPTLCWFDHSDKFLLFLCWGGVGLSVLLLFGVMPGVVSLLLWVFYLSLCIAGQDFLGFQWDNLLLEAGLLLIFLFPKPFGVHIKPGIRPSLVIIWLLRLLLFRLMFESGMVKLLSGDPHWANLTALTYHYWTQPLPNVISWYAAQLPVWFQKFSCIGLFFIEIFIPFLIFCGRKGRLIAFFGICSLQLLILLTGNYCFFNLLAIGLCLTLLEDEHLEFLGLKPKVLTDGGMIYKIVTWSFGALVFIASMALTFDDFAHRALPQPVTKLLVAISPLRSINTYGLFAVMTTQRNEIILEGSDDGDNWKPYEFPYKPGNVDQAPRWVVPFQPRLDWQMWFAALSPWRDNPWLMNVMYRLLQNEPSVTRLFAVNPFKDHPPRFIQATFWDYRFTDRATRKQTGAWWKRDVQGLYCPTASLR